MNLPPTPFFLFGEGHRKKMIYRKGCLISWPDGKVIFRHKDVAAEKVDAPACRVSLDSGDGRKIAVYEDQVGIWVEEDGLSRCLCESPVKHPAFEGHPHAPLLSSLHHEILVNILNGAPVPNFLVYPKPWYRDAALVAMALEHTHNMALIRDWIISLGDCFDRLNPGDPEPDNLGQLLYMLSLVSNKSHPLAPRILEHLRDFMDEGAIRGTTDFAEHPVYQTAWLKFGLKAMGLPDYLTIPDVEDSYSTLCWWSDKVRRKTPPVRFHEAADKRPCLAWAEAHFLKLPPPLELAGKAFPLTWEADASQAKYGGMMIVDPAFTDERICAPHAWHAAEMFLYLLECT